jgi:HSP20 family protein
MTDDLDRLSGDAAPATRTPAARHEDDLTPGKITRDRVESSRSERIGDGTPAAGPVTSPPVPAEGAADAADEDAEDVDRQEGSPMSDEMEHDVPVRVHRRGELLVLAAPMPGLEASDISVTIAGDVVRIDGARRGPHQMDLDVVIEEWTIGPYRREVMLPEPVDAAKTNATYGNGVLVLTMPKAAPGEQPEERVLRLDTVKSTRGRRVGRAAG